MSEIKYVNMDVLDPQDKGVVLGGEKFIIAGHIPTKLMLKCLDCTNKFNDIDTKDTKKLNDNVIDFYKSLYDVIKLKNDIEYDDFVDKVGKVEKGVALFNFIFADMTPEETQKAIAKENADIKPEKKNQE
jgi:hypothetical protein